MNSGPKTEQVPQKTETTPRFAALIAAYNEADRIKETVIAAALAPGVAGVIVADDGSTDDTGVAAAEAGALVVRNKYNLGKGQAMELAAKTLCEVRPFGAVHGVLLLDGDLASSASACSELLVPLVAERADLVIGALPSPSGKAGFGLVQSLARDAIREFGGGFEATAPLSGQRALTLDCLEKVRPFAKGYTMEVAMTVTALRHALRVEEVPVDMQHRYTKRNLSGFMHRGQQFFEINRYVNTQFKSNRSG